MKFKDLEVTFAWQFEPHNNKGQPDFVQVSQALGGPRAIVRPPMNPDAAQADVHDRAPNSTPMNVILHLAPGDWCIGFGNGTFTQLNAHAAATMFVLPHPDEVMKVG